VERKDEKVFSLFDHVVIGEEVGKSPSSEGQKVCFSGNTSEPFTRVHRRLNRVWTRCWLGTLGMPGTRLARSGPAWTGKKEVSVMKKSLLRKSQKGQGLVEYSLIIALVAIVVIAILVLMGPQIGQIFSTITHGL
jgi:pilus assembly protein Flp/PilA